MSVRAHLVRVIDHQSAQQTRIDANDLAQASMCRTYRRQSMPAFRPRFHLPPCSKFRGLLRVRTYFNKGLTS
jgi:hypothetical protein